ncbi:hypothetical protein TIFTF001_002643 [Ficus carica]|uniref:Uncharacterized protein n=1 Tax=Ficus carica TaxID=3494 RepID=A0AA87Z5S8_FICCA|nr:hypothetical protein TIFTF001_002643 [Ficus carica]
MSACLTVKLNPFSFLSSTSQSLCLGFSAALPLLPHNVVVSTFAFTRPSTRQLRNALSFMATVASDSSYSNPDYAEIIILRHGETEWNSDGRIQGHLDVELNDAGRQQAAAVADRLSKEPNISAIYSSDLKRALETAEIIATSCGGLEVIKDTGIRERHLGNLQGLVFRDAARVHPEAYEAFVSPRKDQEIPALLENVGGTVAETTGVSQLVPIGMLYEPTLGPSLCLVEEHPCTELQICSIKTQTFGIVNLFLVGILNIRDILGGGESRDQLYQRCTSTLLRIGRKHKGERIILVTHGGFIRTLYKWACPNEKSPGKVLNTSINVFRLADGDKWTLGVWGDVSHLDQTGYLVSGFGGDKNSG